MKSIAGDCEVTRDTYFGGYKETRVYVLRDTYLVLNFYSTTLEKKCHVSPASVFW